MSENDDLLPEYLAESIDFINQAREGLDNIAKDLDKVENLNSIFRAVHTIKGGASIFGFNNTKEWAHKLENILDGFRKAPDTIDNTNLSKIEKDLDHLQNLIENNDRAPEVIESSEPSTDEHEPMDFDQLTEDLVNVAGEGQVMEEVPVSPVEPIKVKKAEVAIPAAPAASSEMLRVPVSRIQKNLETISEIFLIKNQLSYLIDNFIKSANPNHEFVYRWETLDNSLRRSICELESIAMSMRMMPLTGLFSRLEKTVRSYVTESSKLIRVEKNGEDTELDKKVLDALSEPFIHLIRNAMDHGIETQSDRLKKQKPAEGVIKLEAHVFGNEVILTISDDGQGLDPQKIKSSAERKGINTSHVNDDKSAQELIFLPGFSTAEKVTETSGRGVGMDVVKTAIENLGGTIVLESRVGEGTRLSVRIPLGMTVVPALIVTINGELYGIGTNEIIETRRVAVSDMKTNRDSMFYLYRNKFIPCYNLENFVSTDKKSNSYHKNVLICIVKVDSEFIAIQVSSLEGNTEIVVKAQPKFSPSIPYILGTSLLPDGTPLFVLSLKDLYKLKMGLDYEKAVS